MYDVSHKEEEILKGIRTYYPDAELVSNRDKVHVYICIVVGNIKSSDISVTDTLDVEASIVKHLKRIDGAMASIFSQMVNYNFATDAMCYDVLDTWSKPKDATAKLQAFTGKFVKKTCNVERMYSKNEKHEVVHLKSKYLPDNIYMTLYFRHSKAGTQLCRKPKTEHLDIIVPDRDTHEKSTESNAC